MRKSRLSKQQRLIEHFVAGTTARCAVSLVGIHKKCAAYDFQKLGQLIAFQLEQEAHDVFGGERKVDESWRNA